MAPRLNKIRLLVEKITTLEGEPYFGGGTFGKPSQITITCEFSIDEPADLETSISFQPRFGKDLIEQSQIDDEERMAVLEVGAAMPREDGEEAMPLEHLATKVSVEVNVQSSANVSRRNAYMFGEIDAEFDAQEFNQELDITLENDKGPCAILHLIAMPKKVSKRDSSSKPKGSKMAESAGNALFGFLTNATRGMGQQSSGEAEPEPASGDAAELPSQLTSAVPGLGKYIKPDQRTGKALRDTEDFLDKSLSSIPFFDQLEQHLKLQKVWILIFTITIIAMLALAANLGRLARFATQVVSVIYPGWRSFRAIESKDKGDDTFWLSYWVALGTVVAVEEGVHLVLVGLGFPHSFFHIVKLIFVAWLVFPNGRGLRVLYDHGLSPFLRRNEHTFENIFVKPFVTVFGAADDAAKYKRRSKRSSTSSSKRRSSRRSQGISTPSF